MPAWRQPGPLLRRPSTPGGVIPLRVGAALVQSTQTDAVCVGGDNGLGGSRNFSSSCQPGHRSVSQRAKAGGGLLWRWDPALSTSILCQAGQRGPSAPMESPSNKAQVIAADAAFRRHQRWSTHQAQCHFDLCPWPANPMLDGARYRVAQRVYCEERFFLIVTEASKIIHLALVLNVCKLAERSVCVMNSTGRHRGLQPDGKDFVFMCFIAQGCNVDFPRHPF